MDFSLYKRILKSIN